MNGIQLSSMIVTSIARSSASSTDACLTTVVRAWLDRGRDDGLSRRAARPRRAVVAATGVAHARLDWVVARTILIGMTLGLVLGKQRARMEMQARGLARVAVRCCGVVHAASCQRYACRVGRDHLSTRARRANARVVAALRRRARAREGGLRAVLHHTAVVVSNLERSIAFYERHLGGRLEYVVRDNDDLRIAELLQLPEIRLSFAFIAFEYAHLELLEFSVPADGRRFDARANDFGTTHLSFQVEDVQAAYERLAADGVELTRPPAPTLPIVFCFDPDGNRIELIQRRTD